MRRRPFLSACGTSLTVVLAGCQGSSDGEDPEDDDDSGDDSPPGPKEVVRSYLNALYGATAAEINAYLHPDAELPEFTAEQVERYDGQSIKVESIEVLSKEKSTATLQTSVRVDTGGQTLSDTAEYELRTADGSWKIYATKS